MAKCLPEYSNPIKLDEPIKRADKPITEVKLRKPAAGELRGLNLVNLMNGDVNSLVTLLPRISEPTLTENDIKEMELCDLVLMGDAVAVFLQPKSVRQEASPAA